MSKRQKLPMPTGTVSELRQRLDAQGWCLYDRSWTWPDDMLFGGEWFHWYVMVDVCIRGPDPKNFKNISTVEIDRESNLLHVFNLHVPSPWLFDTSNTNIPESHWRHKIKPYGWKAFCTMSFDFIIKRFEVPRSPSWLCHPTAGIVRGYARTDGAIEVTTLYGENIPILTAYPTVEVVPLCELNNLRQPFLHYCLFNLCIVGGCVMPVLEAVYLNWPDASERTNPLFGVQLKSLNSPILQYECKDGLIREVLDRDAFKRSYK